LSGLGLGLILLKGLQLVRMDFHRFTPILLGFPGFCKSLAKGLEFVTVRNDKVFIFAPRNNFPVGSGRAGHVRLRRHKKHT